MAPGFEPMTFRMWVSSYNHQTRAPTLISYFYFSLNLFWAPFEPESFVRFEQILKVRRSHCLVVVALLVERLLKKPEIYSLNPVISKFDLPLNVLTNCIEKTINKENEARGRSYIEHLRYDDSECSDWLKHLEYPNRALKN